MPPFLVLKCSLKCLKVMANDVSNILTWQNEKLATVRWYIRCFWIFTGEMQTFETLGEGGGHSSQVPSV